MPGQSQSNAPIPIRVVEADLKLPEHQKAVLAMVDAYSRDSMGKAKPLHPDVRARLIPGLQKHPTTLVFLAFAGEQAVGAGGLFHRFLDLRRETAHQHS
jgi:hypothetical protein